MTDNLHILQWNCRAISSGLPHLLKYLQDNPTIDIILLQSPNTTIDKLPKILGFYSPSSVREGKKVMVATYISTRLQFLEAEIKTDVTDCRLSLHCLTIPTKTGKDINVANVYYPGSSNSPDHARWLTQLDTKSHSWIVGGDFNCKNKLWDCGASDTSDAHLVQAIEQSDLVTLNDGTPTRLGYNHQKDTAPDLTLVSADLALKAEWDVGTDNLQSDHLPIHIRLNIEALTTEQDSTPTYQFHKANWNTFQAHLTTLCSDKDNNPRHNDIEEYYCNVRQILLSAADHAIPKKAPRAKREPAPTPIWWNNECEEATTTKRKALRKYQANRCATNRAALHEATRACASSLLEAKKSHWEEFCQQEVQGPQDTSKVWKRLKLLKGGRRLPDKPLIHQGRPTRSNQEKADALAETFAKISQTAHLPPEEQQRRREAETNFTAPDYEDNTTPYNSDITPGEVRAAILDITNKSKATGQDPVSYHMVKHLNEPAIRMLTEFYQACWEQGQIPKAWKKSEVIGIKKDGKPANQPTSYRPISLTPHLGKLYERILKDRLQHHLDSNNIIPPLQAGFRPGRNCIEHVHTLLEDIKEANSRKTKKWITTAAFFDIKKAFDTVWHGKLLDKLKGIGISGRLYHFIASFLHQREFHVKVGEATSTTQSLDMGVPQGSVIAPILFNIMLHDIIQPPKDSRMRITLYADDLAVWAQHLLSNRHNAMPTFQNYLNEIQSYMQENGFQLAADKTVFMVFGRGRPDRSRYWINIGGHTIDPSKQVKFLGVTIDQNITWQTHFNKLITKARRSLNVVKILSYQSWASPKSVLHVARALVRSRLMYGHQVTFTATDSQWAQLQATDAMAIKAALNIPWSANTCLVYQEAGWLPIRREFERLNARFEVRKHAIPDTQAPRLLNSPNAGDLAFRRRNEASISTTEALTTNTKPTWDACHQDPTKVIPWPNSHPKAWLLERPEIITTIPGNVTKKENPNLLEVLAKEHLSSRYSLHLQVYTDGSILDKGQTGSAAVIPDLKMSRTARLNKGVSIFTAELHAIQMACDALLELPAPPDASSHPLRLEISSPSTQAENNEEQEGTNFRDPPSVSPDCHQRHRTHPPMAPFPHGNPGQ